MCECSTNGTDLHLALHDGYIIRQSEQFFRCYKTYLQTMMDLVRLSSINVTSEINEQILNDIKLNHPVEPIDSLLRQLVYYLPSSEQNYGNLCRSITPDGHIRWLCMEHYLKVHEFSKEFCQGIESIGSVYDRERSLIILNNIELTKNQSRTLGHLLCYNNRICELLLKKIKIRVKDFEKLISKICQQSTLRSLELNELSIVSLFGVNKTKECLNEQLKHLFHSRLTEIRIIKNVINDDGGQIMTKNFEHIKYLTLQENHLSTKTLERIIQTLKTNMTLIKFELMIDNDPNKYLQNLFQSLEFNQRLEELSLFSSNTNYSLVNQTSHIIVQSLERNNRLKSLILRNFCFSSSCMKLFARLFEMNQTKLKQFGLNSCQIEDESIVLLLLNALKTNKNLIQLDLTGIQLSNDIKYQIEQLMETNNGLNVKFE
ncbi:unnamed protein product [Didymodactylos carnosus]|uniref:Uncharacterized protein n=2 Tax=Didymodactylos carnosus TaxID=1234261 RepID=A0A816CPX4_9BILA|nr:unnamed protein product [Didymodactylos carnosus]CAF4519055.1 unnamed protein product [Didymodactylos carnosus]